MSIRFLLDENMPFALIDLFERRGYLVEHLKKIGKGGIKDGEVYRLAEKNKMWIVTRDADFQSYYKFISHDVGGIILVKLTITKTDHLLKTITKVLNKYKNKFLEKHLVIVEDEVIRIYT